MRLLSLILLAVQALNSAAAPVTNPALATVIETRSVEYPVRRSIELLLDFY